MKKSWLIIIIIVLVAVLAGLIIKNKFFSTPGKGAIQITTSPKATVLIDGTQKGVTAFFDDKVESGEHTIKLVPESDSDKFASWERKVTISPGILTAINWTFGQSDSASFGETVWLEKIPSRDKSSLSVVSVPDQVVVKFDGEPKGFTPLLVENLSPGSHELVMVTPGYEELKIPAKTVAGYKLVVNVQLSQKLDSSQGATESGQSASPSPSPSSSPKASASPSPKASPTPSPKASPKPSASPSATPDKPYVTVKETSTGWLRVRSSPSSTADELAKIYPGDSFPYLNEEQNGWLKIEYETGKEGWVSGTYVTLVK